MSQVGQRQRLSLPVDNESELQCCSSLTGPLPLCLSNVPDVAVENLLLWRDPIKTGGVFGVITLVYLLLEWTHFSLLRLVANTLLGVVCIAFLWSNGAQFLNK